MASAAALLHRQTAAIVAMTSATDADERARLVAELERLATEAEAAFPTPPPA